MRRRRLTHRIRVAVLTLAGISLLSEDALSQTVFGIAQGGEVRNVKYMIDALETLGDVPPGPFRVDHVLDYYLPMSDGHADFSQIDSLLRLIETYSFDPIFCLSYIPSLKGRSSPDGYSEPAVESYVEKCSLLVQYLVRVLPKQRITYEIWNEPNELWFWNGTATQYAILYDRTHRMIKKIDPDAIVGGPSISGLQSWKIRWLRQFLKVCKKQAIEPDFISFHYYKNEGREFRTGLRNLRTTVEELLGVLPPLYITEWNVSPKKIVEDAGTLTRRKVLMDQMRDEGITLATYFELRQVGPSRSGLGLVNSQGEVSPFWPIFKELAR